MEKKPKIVYEISIFNLNTIFKLKIVFYEIKKRT